MIVLKFIVSLTMLNITLWGKTNKIDYFIHILPFEYMVRTTSDKQNSRPFQGLFKDKN